MQDSPPPAPDASQSAAKGVIADASTLAARDKINAAQQIGGQAILSASDLKSLGLDPKDYTPSGNGYAYSDFTGAGNDAIGKAQANQYMDIMGQQAPKLLDYEQQYGSQFAKEYANEINAADPNRALGQAGVTKLLTEGQPQEDATTKAIRDSLGSSVLQDINAGGNLTPDQQYQTEQQIRRAQVGRGGDVFGNSAVNEEGLLTAQQQIALNQQRQGTAQNYLGSGQSTGDYNQRMYQQNLANNSQAANQTPITSFFSGLGSTSGSAPSNTAGTTASNIGLNANAGQQGMQFAQQNYQQQSQNWANSVSPFMAMAGMGTQMASAYLGAPQKN